MPVLFLKTSEPRDAVCRSTCPAAVRAVRSVSKFMHRHIRIAYKDHLVIARDIPQHPVGFQRLLGIDRWIPVKSFLKAVVEIIYLQIRECVRLVQRLEKQAAELLIRAHRTARIDQQQQLQPVFSRRLHPYIEDPTAAACAVDRSAYIQLLFAVFKLSRQFSQQPERHLELP